MTQTSRKKAADFLAISDQFRLGSLVTESSHPVTANLSEVATRSISDALGLLFEADKDVLVKYRQWAASNLPDQMKSDTLDALRRGGRVFFTGCGSTGRLSILLDSMWRDLGGEWADRTMSVMAGGDYALIKSVEGFEDYAAFGAKQIGDLNVGRNDIVFAITEGGETSFVIGTAEEALARGARVYFVYNNPDDILRETVERSRRVIENPDIEKINLTTGPMSITGSTRMQATTIQLCVMGTVLEMVARELAGQDSSGVTDEIATALDEVHSILSSEATRNGLARIVEMEESTYRSGHRNNYFADYLGIDILTDTTERSPTYCTPPFRKFDDTSASESWAFLYLPYDTPDAWRHILKREPRCVEWSSAEISELVEAEKAPRVEEIMRGISCDELMKFKIGIDGMNLREPRPGDSAIGVAMASEYARSSFIKDQLNAAKAAGAQTCLILFGDEVGKGDQFTLRVPIPTCTSLLNVATRACIKMYMNALSTCTMVRLGRVMGNYMIYVVPSNLKLIDRATRYISRLANLDYVDACNLLFEVIEYVEPRMKSDRAYPPVVGVAVLRATRGISNEEAEDILTKETPR